MTKTFRKPDLNAPRYRPNRLNLLNKKFCNEFREANPETTLTDDQIKQIVYEYNGLLWETALQCRDGVELPEGLGHIFIGCCPPKKTKNIDFARSRELGVTVQHQNWETDGTVGKIFYSNFESANKFRFTSCGAFPLPSSFAKQ